MLKRSNYGMMAALCALAGTLAASGCQDLAIENTMAADRDRATSNPSDVEAFIGGAFYPRFFQALHDDVQVIAAWLTASSDMTATMAGQGTLLQYQELVEPRVPHDNGAVLSLGNGPQGPRDFWAAVTQASSVAYDGLQLIGEGMVITNGGQDVTPRAQAFAKFMQGWAWGYLALAFDRSHVLPETIDIPADPDALREVTLNSLLPYDQAIEAAIASLDEAIAIAEVNPEVVHFPGFSESSLWFGSPSPISNRKFIEMANTLAARLLVLNARTPEERSRVDWQRVLEFTANGLADDDYEFQLTTTRKSDLLLYAQANTTSGTRNARWDYRTIGPADQSGAYQAWIAAPIAGRDRFEITTPDRRITGPTPTSDGAYTTYRADDNGFEPDRGRYLFSAYQWRRHASAQGLIGPGDTGYNSGTVALITADENTLLRAEALLRTGDAAGAAELINVTRTRDRVIGLDTYPGLPPVTAAGVPEVDGACVPRTDAGACGSLLDALRYERMIELTVMDSFRGYAESRGWGILPDGALLHWPIPGNVLDLYGLENYSFGGPGNPGTAVYAPASLP